MYFIKNHPNSINAPFTAKFIKFPRKNYKSIILTTLGSFIVIY